MTGATSAARLVGESFLEQLRSDVARHKRPKGAALTLRCVAKGHPLLWLVPGPGGLVPVAAAPGRPAAVQVKLDADGQPLTLAGWPTDDPLPLGYCLCGVADMIDQPLLQRALQTRAKKTTVTPKRVTGVPARLTRLAATARQSVPVSALVSTSDAWARGRRRDDLRFCRALKAAAAR